MPAIATPTIMQDVTHNAPTKPASFIITELSPPPVTLHIYDAATLYTAPCLPAITSMINHAFVTHWAHLLPAENKEVRFSTPTELPEDITPGGFTIVAFAANDSLKTDPLAVSSVKCMRHDSYWEEWGPVRREKLKAWKAELAEKIASGQDQGGMGPIRDWEITAVAVKYVEGCKKRGLAARVVRACEEELRRRLGSEEGGVCRAWVRIMKEVNGKYWSGKGFDLVEERTVPAGTWRIPVQLTNWDMVKEIRAGEGGAEEEVVRE